MDSAVPKLFRHGAKTLAYRADFLARVNGVLINVSDFINQLIDVNTDSHRYFL